MGRAATDKETTMNISRLLPQRTRNRVFAAGVAFAIASGSAIALVNPEPANAIGLNHKIDSTTKQNNSLAVEKPGFSFQCNDTTGAYKFKVSNAQVIAADHVSRWTDLTVTVTLSQFDQNDWTVVGPISLSQNATTGLFTATSSGTLAPTTHFGLPGYHVCRGGSWVQLEDGDLTGNLNITWQLV
jgi:hypothetical protein